jgi:hypothetical protein
MTFILTETEHFQQVGTTKSRNRRHPPLVETAAGSRIVPEIFAAPG